MSPPPDQSLLQKAEGLADAGRFDEAGALCDEELARSWDSAAAWNLKGFCLASLGRPADALACFKRARLHLPTYPDIRFNLARALEDTGDTNEALAEYSETLRLAPGHAAALRCRGSIVMRRGELAAALKDLDAALALEPGSAEGHVLRGACRLMSGNRAAADEDFSRAVALDPSQKDRVCDLIAELSASRPAQHSPGNVGG